jgi:hypothetical protein
MKNKKVTTVNEALELEMKVEDTLQGVVNETQALAMKQTELNKEKVKKVMEERSKNAVESERQPKTIKSALLKRMYLSESLFESIEEERKPGLQKLHEAADEEEVETPELWYDMQQFVTDLYSRPDTTRPDEFPKKMYSRVFNRNGVAYDKVFAPTEKELMFEWSDLPSAQDAIKLAKELKLTARGKKEGKDKFNVYIEIPMTSVGQFECIGDWFEDNGLVLEDWLTDTYIARLAKRGELFANPDKNKEFLSKAKTESLKLTEDLKYGQTKYEELVSKIREYWDAPAIDNLCDVMKDIDEQAAYDIVYKCAEFLEEHADEAIEDSQKYPVEKPKAYDSGFVSAEDKQPKKDLLTENVGFDKVLPIVKDWFSHLGDEDCENIAQAFAIGIDEGKDCFEILNSLAKDYSFEAAEFEGICPELQDLSELNESVVMNEEAKVISSLEDYTPWAGAAETWDRISDEGKIEELDNLLEELYPDGIGLTELNDLLWFEQDWIYEQLGIAEDEEEE